MQKKKPVYLRSHQGCPDEGTAKFLANLYANGKTFRFMVGAAPRRKVYNEPTHILIIKKGWATIAGAPFEVEGDRWQNFAISELGKTALEVFLRNERLGKGKRDDQPRMRVQDVPHAFASSVRA